MAMNHRDYAIAAGLQPSPATIVLVDRVRNAGAWLRNRAYRRFLASDRDDAAEANWIRAVRASEIFEQRRLAVPRRPT